MRTASRAFSRRGLLSLGAGAAAGLAGCGSHTSSDGTGASDGSSGGNVGGASGAPQGRLIGDGSTSYTGKQPHQPAAPEPLQPGQTPP
ncbi:hypothetical protein ACFV2N_48480, partial [Streptomyces sp. NPDC059680]